MRGKGEGRGGEKHAMQCGWGLGLDEAEEAGKEEAEEGAAISFGVWCLALRCGTSCGRST